MAAHSARITPVIAAIGEQVDRPNLVEQAREPVDLMADALRACEADAGVRLLEHVNLLNLVGLVSWPYKDPVSLLAQRLAIVPAEVVNASMGGETPVRLAHEAARRIALGEDIVAAIVGGEAVHARGQADKAGVRLPWTPQATKDEAFRFASRVFAISPVAKQLGVMNPAQVYPFYEVAAQAAWGQTPAEGMRESAELWARYAAVAADNPFAWIRSAPTAEAIGAASAENRLVNWPYPKLMNANPVVNQSAAAVVMSLARAREIGIAESRLVHVWGGASALEPEDYLLRDRYDRSAAQAAVLEKAVSIAGGDAGRVRHLELYSCFPIVPKMAMRTLGLDPATCVPTVTGGLTFFGGPLNNYMTHAMAAMVRALRREPHELGLLYGQGGYVNKHHALVLGVAPPPAPLASAYSVQDIADAMRGPVPPLHEDYVGPAIVETYTVRYARDGTAEDAIVIARTPDGGRTMAASPASDKATIAMLTSPERTAVGLQGRVAHDAMGQRVWGH